MSRALEGTII